VAATIGIEGKDVITPRLIIAGGELSQKKPKYLIILMVANRGTRILFQDGIDTFQLTISRRVKCYG
jgi:hypothetical protein